MLALGVCQQCPNRGKVKACNDPWRVDETSVKVKKAWMYLYRAVDSAGTPLEFLLSSTRDAEAARRFFCKALQRPISSVSQSSESEEHAIVCLKQETQKASQPALRVLNGDKNAASPRAIADLKAAGILPDHVE